MKINCPECATQVDGTPGEEVVCPACMALFVAPRTVETRSVYDLPDGPPARTPPPPPIAAPMAEPVERRTHGGGTIRSFDVMLADGTLLSGLSRYAIRERVYLGQIPNTAKLRRPGGDWNPIGMFRDYGPIFKVMGADPLPVPPTRKLSGWKSEAPAQRPQAPPPPPVVEAPPLITVQEAGQERTYYRQVLVLSVLGMFLVAILIGWWMRG